MTDDKTDQSNTDRRGTIDRHWVTMIVLIGSFAGLIGLATLIIIGSWSQKPSDDAKNLFNALLPVFGTWVGTLLAFYFSKDNFEAATKSISEMATKISGADERLKQIPVRDKMRTLKDITSWPMKKGDEDKSRISDILAKFARLDRIPMLDDKGVVVYLVYKNVLYQFLSELALHPEKMPKKPDQTPKQVADLTFKDILDFDSNLKNSFEKSFDFVREGATLADAKQKMEATSKTTPCNDIFVTHTGQPTEPVVGWITDNKIGENLKV